MALSSQYQKAKNLSWISINRILSSHPTLSVEECCSGFCYENILESFITGLHGCHVMTLLPRNCCEASEILDQVQLGCSCCSGHLHPTLACGLLKEKPEQFLQQCCPTTGKYARSEWLTIVYFLLPYKISLSPMTLGLSMWPPGSTGAEQATTGMQLPGLTLPLPEAVCFRLRKPQN